MDTEERTRLQHNETAEAHGLHIMAPFPVIPGLDEMDVPTRRYAKATRIFQRTRCQTTVACRRRTRWDLEPCPGARPPPGESAPSQILV